MEKRELASYIDHTNLKADAKTEDIVRLCDEAAQYHFHSVCVNSTHAALVSTHLRGTDVVTCCVVGFPLGAMVTNAKAYEARAAVLDGAGEIDMVMNIGAMKDKNYDLVREDIRAVRDAARPALLKVIIECCLLTKEEIVKACELAEEAGADFVKTSTGFSTGGAKTEDVALMKKTVGDRLKVKASGGIHTKAEAEAMIEAGADRIGTSSGIAIMNS